MNYSVLASVSIAIIGFLGNLIWMLFNQRIENRILLIETRIGTKIDDLKVWMEGRYVSIGVFQSSQSLCTQRSSETERRLAHLESSSFNAAEHQELQRRVTRLEGSPPNSEFERINRRLDRMELQKD